MTKMVKLGRLLRPREVAVLIGMTPRTVSQMCRDGRLGGFKVGRVWRIPSDDPQLHAILHTRAEGTLGS